MDFKVVKPLWDGSGWHQVGSAFPPEVSVVQQALIDKYFKGGFIDTPENIARLANPEAFEASSNLQQVTQQLQEAQSRVQELEGEVTTLTGKVDAAAKQAQADAAELTRLRAAQGKPEDVAELAEYREVVGELLDKKFPERALLLDNGYYTKSAVQGTDDETLKAIDGIADAKLALIRKAAPYTPPSE